MQGPSLMSNIFNYLAVIFFVVCWGLIVFRFIKSRYARVRAVKAVITDKYKNKIVSRMQGTLKKESYIVVFDTGNKKLSFMVSEFSFANYRVGEKGTLTYKGDRLIDFK